MMAASLQPGRRRRVHLPSPPLLLLLLALLVLSAGPGPAAARRRPSKKAERLNRRQRAAHDEDISELASAEYDAALAAEERYDYDEAEAAYARAAKIAPVWDAPGVNRAVLLSKMRRPREAVEQYEAVLETHPQNTLAVFNLAK